MEKLEGFLELPEEDRWLFLYMLPCHGGNIEYYNRLKQSPDFVPSKYLNGDKSQEAVFDYFYGIHNEKTFANAQQNPKSYFHMLIPYPIVNAQEKIKLRVKEDFLDDYDNFPDKLFSITLNQRQMQRIKQFNIADSEELELGDVVYIHGGEVVDVEKNSG